MRPIKKIHTAGYAPIADLITYTPFPSAELEQLDPFLLLNHHGFQQYGPQNRGLPFGPHPHRGMETLTFILEGDIQHRDNGGHQSIIEAGGIQYMRAGRGLLHAETSSEDFKKKGGSLEVLQLWLNMPARQKMSKPLYQGKQADAIPKIPLEQNKGTINLVFGSWQGTPAALQHEFLDIFLSWVELKEGGKFKILVPADHSILCYMVRGEARVQQQEVRLRQLVEFERGSGVVEVQTDKGCLFIFGHAQPLDEPVVAQGPFVMNTREEIAQAYADLQQGKFGSW